MQAKADHKVVSRHLGKTGLISQEDKAAFSDAEKILSSAHFRKRKFETHILLGSQIFKFPRQFAVVS